MNRRSPPRVEKKPEIRNRTGYNRNGTDITLHIEDFDDRESVKKNFFGIF